LIWLGVRAGEEHVPLLQAGGRGGAIVSHVVDQHLFGRIGQPRAQALGGDDPARPRLYRLPAHQHAKDRQHRPQAAGEGQAHQEGAGDRDDHQAAVGGEVAGRPPEVGDGLVTLLALVAGITVV